MHACIVEQNWSGPVKLLLEGHQKQIVMDRQTDGQTGGPLLRWCH